MANHIISHICILAQTVTSPVPIIIIIIIIIIIGYYLLVIIHHQPSVIISHLIIISPYGHHSPVHHSSLILNGYQFISHQSSLILNGHHSSLINGPTIQQQTLRSSLDPTQ